MSDPALEAGDFMGAGTPQPSDEMSGWDAADSSDASPPVPQHLMQRLESLAARLHQEGREQDADLITEALATINLG